MARSSKLSPDRKNSSTVISSTQAISPKAFSSLSLISVILSEQFWPHLLANLSLILIGLSHLPIRRSEKRLLLVLQTSVIDHPEVTAGVEKSRSISTKQYSTVYWNIRYSLNSFTIRNPHKSSRLFVHKLLFRIRVLNLDPIVIIRSQLKSNIAAKSSHTQNMPMKYAFIEKTAHTPHSSESSSVTPLLVVLSYFKKMDLLHYYSCRSSIAHTHGKRFYSHPLSKSHVRHHCSQSHSLPACVC